MKSCFWPGDGFPARLQRLLWRLNRRPADIERETDGLVKAETIRGWIDAKHFPDKQTFVQFCRTCRLDQREARELLFGPEGERDGEHLQRVGEGRKAVKSLLARLATVEAQAAQLTVDEVDLLCQRLADACKQLRARDCAG